MGAITDRLDITLQDVKQWLKLPLEYPQVVVEILADPPTNTDFTVVLTYQETTKEYIFDSGATPTPATVAAGIVAEISGDAIPGITTTDLGGGRYQIKRSSPTAPYFEAWFSRGQKPDPVPQLIDDHFLEALLQTALTMADAYCNNPFVDDDGENEPIPNAVRTGVLQTVDWLYADREESSAASTGVGFPAGPIKKKKAKNLEVTYATASETKGGVGSRDIGDLPSFAKNILAMYRLMPGGEERREARPRDLGLSNMTDFSDPDEW